MSAADDRLDRMTADAKRERARRRRIDDLTASALRSVNALRLAERDRERQRRQTALDRNGETS